MILKKHYQEKLTVIFAIKEDYDHREVYYYENRRFEGELHMFFDDKKQQLESIGRFKSGKKSGVHEEYYENGVLKISKNFIDGLEDGKYEEYFENGEVKLSCFYIEGKRNGKSQEFYEDGGLKEENNYYYGNLDGISSRFHKNGKILCTGMYKEDLKTGIWNFFDENESLVRKEIWKDGKLNGQRIELENGNVQMSSNYVDGELDGEFIIYDKNKNIAHLIHYEEGRKNGKETFYNESGSVKKETDYKNNMKYGAEKEYSNDGEILLLDANYVEGLLHGSYASYYEDGNRKFTGRAMDGEFHGEAHFYDENGDLESEVFYEHGKVMRKIEHKK